MRICTVTACPSTVAASNASSEMRAIGIFTVRYRLSREAKRSKNFVKSRVRFAMSRSEFHGHEGRLIDFSAISFRELHAGDG